MDLQIFTQIIQEKFPIGSEFNNPGGGKSTIESYSVKNLYYRRGKTKISVSYQNLLSAYLNFKGTKVTASDLKVYAPNIFNSNARPGGHSCNCTLLFLLLSNLGLSSRIQGEGVRGSPYWVSIH